QHFGPGADEYAVHVDRETGSLLRVETRREGSPFQVTEIVSIAFDEPLPAETFVLEPPEGEVIELVEVQGTRFRMPLSEIVDEAGFTVFVPDRVPNDWRLDAHYSPARKRPPSHAVVILFYRSEDATGSLSVSESRAGEDKGVE